jgi:UDP-N-acetyl-D-mannosaminuronic acid dehydrogenase
MGSNKYTSIIVGGGFVGLTLTARLLKNKDVSVVLIDSDQNKITNFNKKIFGVNEPGLDEVLSTAMKEKRLTFNSDLPSTKCNFMFICISTPKNQLFEKNLSILYKIFDKYSEALNPSASIFLRSTVQIGTTSKLNQYIENSKRNDICVFYAPERTAEGVALKELDSLPQILGSVKQNELAKGSKILASLDFEVVPVSNSDSAEFVKLMCNIWRDTTFAISNDFAMMGESLSLNTYDLIEKANFEYPRARIPMPGPVGGPCLSKDTYILLESLPKNLSGNRLIGAARILNESLEEIALSKIFDYMSKKNGNLRVIFLGAAFKGKPDTNDFRESFTKNLVEKLLKSSLKLDISIWDPNLIPVDLFEYAKFYLSDLIKKDFDIVVIGNNSNFMLSEEVSIYLNNLRKDSLIIDMWGVISNPDALQASLYQFGNSLRN